MIVWSAAEYADRKKLNSEIRAAIVLAILAVLSLLSSRQIEYWQSDYALCAHAATVEPGNMLVQSLLTSLVYNRTLAEARREEAEQTPEQRAETKRTLDAELKAYRDTEIRYKAGEAEQRASKNDHPGLEMDLAAKLMAAQRPAEAVTEFRKALTYSHDLLLNAIIYGRMADAFRLAGDATNQQDAFAHAQDSYRAALRADPDRTTKLTEQLDNSGFNLSALK